MKSPRTPDSPPLAFSRRSFLTAVAAVLALPACTSHHPETGLELPRSSAFRLGEDGQVEVLDDRPRYGMQVTIVPDDPTFTHALRRALGMLGAEEPLPGDHVVRPPDLYVQEIAEKWFPDIFACVDSRDQEGRTTLETQLHRYYGVTLSLEAVEIYPEELRSRGEEVFLHLAGSGASIVAGEVVSQVALSGASSTPLLLPVGLAWDTRPRASVLSRLDTQAAAVGVPQCAETDLGRVRRALGDTLEAKWEGFQNTAGWLGEQLGLLDPPAAASPDRRFLVLHRSMARLHSFHPPTLAAHE